MEEEKYIDLLGLARYNLLLMSKLPTFWVGTQAEYDLIDPIDPSTIYIIK